MFFTMSKIGLRPHFQQLVSGEREAAQQKIAEFFSANAPDFEVKNFPGFMCLRVPEEQRHFWSPRLNLSFDKEESGKTAINGIYGPNSKVWGMFFYGYLFFGFLTLVGGILGASQWAIEKSPSGLWLLFPAVAGLVGLYIAGQTGKKIGARQTLRLHKNYQQAIGEKVPIR